MASLLLVTKIYKNTAMKISETPQKPLLKIYYYNSNKVTRMVKHFQKRSNEKFTSPFNLIVLNTNSHSYWFHSQTFWKDTISSVVKPGVKLKLIGLKNFMIDIYFSILQYIKRATHQVFSFSDVKNEKGLTRFVRVTLSKYGKAFGLPATPVVLLVSCVSSPRTLNWILL